MGNYGRFPIMDNVGFISSTVVPLPIEPFRGTLSSHITPMEAL